jgi:ankyrin repeat protein
LLLKHGANITAANGNGNTALTFAAIFGHKEIIKLLLDKGADPQLKDGAGKSPIDYALEKKNYEAFDLMAAAVNK